LVIEGLEYLFQRDVGQALQIVEVFEIAAGSASRVTLTG
jgi:hypothetical protein